MIQLFLLLFSFLPTSCCPNIIPSFKMVLSSLLCFGILVSSSSSAGTPPSARFNGTSRNIFPVSVFTSNAGVNTTVPFSSWITFTPVDEESSGNYFTGCTVSIYSGYVAGNDYFYFPTLLGIRATQRNNVLSITADPTTTYAEIKAALLNVHFFTTARNSTFRVFEYKFLYTLEDYDGHYYQRSTLSDGATATKNYCQGTYFAGRKGYQIAVETYSELAFSDNHFNNNWLGTYRTSGTGSWKYRDGPRRGKSAYTRWATLNPIILQLYAFNSGKEMKTDLQGTNHRTVCEYEDDYTTGTIGVAGPLRGSFAAMLQTATQSATQTETLTNTMTSTRTPRSQTHVQTRSKTITQSLSSELSHTHFLTESSSQQLTISVVKTPTTVVSSTITTSPTLTHPITPSDPFTPTQPFTPTRTMGSTTPMPHTPTLSATASLVSGGDIFIFGFRLNPEDFTSALQEKLLIAFKDLH
eukprot:PhM_4_TR11663/c1_g1_i1/m.64047